MSKSEETMSKHPKSRARNGNAKWGPPVNSPGGTTIQISSANGASVKRLKTTTPGGKNNVFHQCCVDSVSCSLLNPCSSCTIKKPTSRSERTPERKPEEFQRNKRTKIKPAIMLANIKAAIMLASPMERWRLIHPKP